MMPVILLGSILAIPVFLYGIQMLRYTYALPFSPEQHASSESEMKTKISLVIAFKDEATNLTQLFSSLDEQDVKADSYEVLFCDDYSSDDSVDLIKDYIKDKPHCSLISSEGVKGKKAAIDRGVEAAISDWIVQSDADCSLPSAFLRRHSELAKAAKVKFIAGPVLYHSGKNCWEKFEELEYMSLMASGRGSFFLKRPIMCSAANMSFSKELYLQNREGLLKSGSISGDDMFLMLEAKRAGSFSYLDGKDVAVLTHPAGSLKKFFVQRIRWASKTGLSKDRDVIAMAVVVFLANFSLLSLLPLAFFRSWALPVFVSSFVFKFATDFLLLWKTAHFYNRKALMLYYPLFSFVYYIYIVVAAVLSQVVKIRWKGSE